MDVCGVDYEAEGQLASKHFARAESESMHPIRHGLLASLAHNSAPQTIKSRRPTNQHTTLPVKTRTHPSMRMNPSV